MFETSDSQSDARTELQEVEPVDDLLGEHEFAAEQAAQAEHFHIGETQPVMYPGPQTAPKSKLSGAKVSKLLSDAGSTECIPQWLDEELDKMKHITATSSGLSNSEVAKLISILSILDWNYANDLTDAASGKVNIVVTDSFKRTPKLLCAMTLGAVILDFHKLSAASTTQLKNLKVSTKKIIDMRGVLCHQNWSARASKPDWIESSNSDTTYRVTFQLFNQELSKGCMGDFKLEDMQAMKKWSFDLTAGLHKLVAPPLLSCDVYVIGRLHRPLGRQVPLFVRALGGKSCKFVQTMTKKPCENSTYDGSSPPRVLILSEFAPHDLRIGPIFTGEILFSLALSKTWSSQLEIFRCDGDT